MKNFFVALAAYKGARSSLNRTVLVVVALLVVLATSGRVMSADLFVFPSEGQSADQLNQDKFECHEWAKQQTGIDPNRVATSVQPEQIQQRGGIFRGAARGATLGVIGGAIGGNARKGAAIGAGIGALRGARRRRQAEQAQMQAYEEANYQRRSLMETFDRAYGACLEGKGYTVK